MKLRLVRLLAPLSLASVLLFQPAITNTVQANVPGIDDEMNDIQGRLLSGFAAFELGPKDNGGGAKPNTYPPPGREARPPHPTAHPKVNPNHPDLTAPDPHGNR